MNNVLRGHLRFVILFSLEEKEMSGSEIMEKIYKDFGWKPSCGSIYPTLNLLEKEKFTKVANRVSSSHKKLYSLTQKGKVELKKNKLHRQSIADEVLKMHKKIASIYDVDIAKVESVMKNMGGGKIPFAQVYDEVEELKIEMFRILSDNLLKENSEEIRKILKKTINDLKKIQKSNPVKK